MLSTDGTIMKLAGAIDVVVRPHRGLDLGAASFEGQPFAWLTPLGEDAPTVAGDWWASWGGGLMTTCGLDNVGEPADGLPLHGTYNYLPARSVEAGGNRVSGTVADARGVVVHREIVNDPDRGHLRITDSTSNTGAEPQPAPLLYHCNLLWGAVEIDSEAVEPRDAASASEDWRILGAGPERVYEHINARLARVRIGELIVEVRSSLPRLWQWVAPELGVLGIEPANCSVRGRTFDTSVGRLPFLQPGETRETTLHIVVSRLYPLSVVVLHLRRQGHPRMPSRLVDRHGRRRERRLGKRSDRNGGHIRRGRERVEDGRTAVGAEVEGSRLAVVGDSHVVAVAAGDVNPAGWEPRLDPERAPGPSLAREAVAHRDPDRVALRRHAKLPAATGGVAGHCAFSQPSSPSDHGTAVPRLKISSSRSSPGKTPILSLSG